MHGKFKEFLALELPELHPLENYKEDPLAELDPFEFKIVMEYFSGKNKSLAEVARKFNTTGRRVSNIIAREEVKGLWRDLRQMYYQDMAIANLKGAEFIHEVLDDKNATRGDKFRAAAMAAEASGTKTPAETEEGAHRGRSIELSDAIRTIISEAVAEGQKRKQEEDILELHEGDDGSFK